MKTVRNEVTGVMEAIIPAKVISISEAVKVAQGPNQSEYRLGQVSYQTPSGSLKTAGAMLWEGARLANPDNFKVGSTIEVAVQIEGDYAGNAVMQLPKIEDEISSKFSSDNMTNFKVMKISHQYPNFTSAIAFVASEKGESKVSDDNKKFAYQVPLANFSKGFDYYELNRAKNGEVYYTIVTMLGFKTICETNSDYFSLESDKNECLKQIYRLNLAHFNKEEYIALKKGYVKKGSGGCGGVTGIFILLAVLSITLIWI